MSTDTDVTKSKDTSKHYVIQEKQIGVWKLFTAERRSPGLWAETRETLSLLKRLIVDIHTVSPKLLYLLLLTKCWFGIEMALEMRIGNMILGQVEHAVTTGKANPNTLLFAVGGKILHSITDSYVNWLRDSVLPRLQKYLDHHFHLKILNDDLQKDLATSTKTSERQASFQASLQSLKTIFELLERVFEITSQLLLLKRVARMKGGRILFGVFLLQSFVARYSSVLIWQKPMFAYISNDAHKRTKALKQFSNGTFRQDIISSNLGNWIMDEYKKAFAVLGTTSTEDIFTQFCKESPLVGVLEDLLKTFPSLYFALIAIKHPQRMSLASMATLQTLGRRLFNAVRAFFYDFRQFRESLTSLKSLYAPKIQKAMEDETSCLIKIGAASSKGMSMVLRDVSFAYPTGGKKTDALKGINLDIKAGQLVIIVGSNGSGKSTLTRILARLYNPSSGEYLVDGQPSTEYSITDHHRVTALLSQDSQVYPLTLAENIGLGYPEHCSDLEMIKEAASEGGAAEFIEELEQGYQTTLESFDCAFHMNLHGDKEHPLFVMSEELEKKSDVSGGQRQRIIAARTFMRFKSGNVTSVIVDEPSSALDADAELQLFQRLISTREGKTMVFVTHRFGHLTKIADHIICMKDGMIIESGKHEELISLEGEYAKLYKIQAQAFSEDSDPPVNGVAT